METSSRHKGKRAEYCVFAELIKRGLDLYLPVLDIGVDAIIRGEDGGAYVELQVKSTEAEPQAGYFNVHDLEPSPNLFIICVDMSKAKSSEYGQPEIWVLPSGVYKQHATIQTLEDTTRYHLPLPVKDRRYGKKTRAESLEEYCATRHEEAWRQLSKRKPASLAEALSEAARSCGHEIVGHDCVGDTEEWMTKPASKTD
ncbi:MAG: hypothetical protein KAW00_04935 [Dehalococcoidia bacterium]|nr:hypothetical protein [Dehalococcoidia bacterium]